MARDCPRLEAYGGRAGLRGLYDGITPAHQLGGSGWAALYRVLLVFQSYLPPAISMTAIPIEPIEPIARCPNILGPPPGFDPGTFW